MPSYISPVKDFGYRYTKHIPVELRPLLGNRTAFRRYIPRCPLREAEAIARRYALDDDEELKALKALSKEDRAALIEGGGDWNAIVQAEPPEPSTVEIDGRKISIAPNPKEEASYKAATKVERKLNSLVMQHSFDNLFKEWIRCKAPARTRNHQATIQQFKKYFGDVDVRKITPPGYWKVPR